MGMVFTEILAKIDRAAVNGQRLHLDIEHVRALATSPVYASIAEMKAKEFADLWEHEPEQRERSRPAAASSLCSGSSDSCLSVCRPPSGARPTMSVKVPPRSIQNCQRMLMDASLQRRAPGRAGA